MLESQKKKLYGKLIVSGHIEELGKLNKSFVKALVYNVLQNKFNSRLK